MSNIGRITGQFLTPASGTTVITVDDAFAVHFWYSRVTADDTVQADQQFGHGFAAGALRDCGMTAGEDGVNQNQRDGRNANWCLITNPAGTTTVVLGNAVTFNVGNVTLSYTTFSANFRIHYEIWYGTDGSAEMREVAANTSPLSDLTMTTPDMVMGWTLGQLHPASSVHAYQAFGVAVDNAGIDQWTQLTYMGDSDTDTVGSALVDGTFLGQYNVDFANWTMAITAIGSNGCTWTGSNTDEIIFLFLDLAGDGVHVDTFAKSTTAAPTTQQMPTFGFTPDGYGIATCNFDLQTINTNRIVVNSFGAYDEETGVGHSALSVGTASSNADRASWSSPTEVLAGSVALQASAIQFSGTPDAITDATPSIEWNPNTTGATDDVIIGVYGHEQQAVDTARAPGVGSLTLTGLVPVLVKTDNHVIPVGVGTLTATGLAPTVAVGAAIDIPVGSLILEGFPPPSVLQPSDFGLKLVGFAPCVEFSFTIPVPQGSLVIDGKVPTVDVDADRIALPDTGTLIAAGEIPTADIDHVISVPVGSLTATGLTPTATTTQNQVISIPVGALVLTGLAPVVVVSLTTAPALGMLVLTGEIPTLVQIDNHIRAPPVGTLDLTGQAPTVLTVANHIAQPGTGTLSLTGLTPTATATENHVISVPLGTLTLSGKVPAVLTGDEHIAQPGAGSLVLAGQAPTVEISRVASPGVGSLVLSGKIPTLDHTASPGVGSLSVSGSVPTVVIGTGIPVPVGSLTLEGFPPPSVLQPSDFGLKLTGFIPTVSVVSNLVATPGVGSLSFTGEVPALEIVITNPESSLFLEGFVPTVTVTPNIFLKVPVGSLILNGFEPLPVIPQGSAGVQPGLGQLNLNGFNPTVYLSKYFPGKGTLQLQGFVPTVTVAEQFVIPRTHRLKFTSDSQTTIFESDSQTTNFSSESASFIIEDIGEPTEIGFVLLEDGNFLLLETGGKIKLENI